MTGNCRFLDIHQIRSSHEFSIVTPPPAAAARLDSAPLQLPEKKPATRTAPARADRPFRGIALILASTVFLGASDVTAKYLSATLPSIEIAWIRFLVFALIMVPAMLPGSPLYALQTDRRGLHVVRGAMLRSAGSNKYVNRLIEFRQLAIIFRIKHFAKFVRPTLWQISVGDM